MAKAEADAAATQDSKGSGGIMQMALAGLGIFVIVTASNVVTTLVFPPKVSVSGEPGAGGAGAAAEKPMAPPLYHALNPPLIANINSDQADFLQVSIELMARDQRVIDAVEEHKAAIRNNLLLMFAATNGDNINSREAKEAMREQVLAEVNTVLEPYLGGDMTVEEVYFTSFVAQ